ncbi:PQQ-binding-like beta-propeller repeat protein [Planctomicrobium sp. SH668]|uniref:outer membrane protein assembly factor BamB family protein n=1 Tax=Planctomicrobium sp. SH668 TaxID=3448126 RepID=UPI003F5BCE29
MRDRFFPFFVIAAILTSTTPAISGDWPQILGPNRNGIAEDEKLAPGWPRSGPPVLWKKSVGSGYAGLAAVGKRACLFHRIQDEEVIECLDMADGKTLWSDASPTTFYPQVGGGDGPLCVPVIHEDFVITYGAQGLLTCLNFTTGQRIWQRDTHQDFNALEGYFGAGSCPIVVGDRVIVNVGGRKSNGGIVAFSLQTGETVWNMSNEPASYSSPVAVEINGEKLVMMVTRYQCQLFDAKTGTILFKFPFGQRGPTVNGACPVVIGDRLLVTSSYGIGAVYGQFDLFGFQKVFDGETPLATQYCTPIVVDGFAYVIDGRDDAPPADLKCIELAGLKSKSRSSEEPANNAASRTPLKWIEHNFGYGTLLFADNKLIIVKTNGELLLVNPNPDSFALVSKCQPLNGVVRALPALSNGLLLMRNEKQLMCLDLRKGL